MKKYLLIVLLSMGLGTYLNAEITTPDGAKKACDAGNAMGYATTLGLCIARATA